MTIDQFDGQIMHPSPGFPHGLPLDLAFHTNGDGISDLLNLHWDPSTGVTNAAQALAAVTPHWDGANAVLDIHTPSGVEGTITLVGMANGLHHGDSFGWENQFGSHQWNIGTAFF
jgi:hypothetical protein